MSDMEISYCVRCGERIIRMDFEKDKPDDPLASVCLSCKTEEEKSDTDRVVENAMKRFNWVYGQFTEEERNQAIKGEWITKTISYYSCGEEIEISIYSNCVHEGSIRLHAACQECNWHLHA